MTGNVYDMGAGTVAVQSEDGRIVVRASGEIDYEAHRELDAVYEAVAGRQPCDVVVDLGATTFVDSVGLGFLVRLHNAVLKAGRRMTVVDASRQVRRTFGLTGLDRVLTLAPPQATQVS
jgi:anti-anti-sigma factor